MMNLFPMMFPSVLDGYLRTPDRKWNYEELSFFLPGKEKKDVELVVIPEENRLRINDKKGNPIKSMWFQWGVPEIKSVDMKGGVLTVKFKKEEIKKPSSKVIPINSR